MKTQNFEETVTGMEPETKYFFMIKAVSESRALVTDEFVISQTTAPLGPPVTVPNGTIRTTSAVVEWEEIPEAAMYHVSAQSTDSEEYDIHYTTTDISHILQDLKAMTNYTVSVLAVLKDTGVTDVSEVTFETAPEPPSFAVVRARVQRDATVKLNATWSEVSGMTMNFIHMSPPHGTFRQEHNSSEFWMNVSGLQLGKTYMFGIFAVLDNEKRTDVRSVTYRTPATPRCYECSSVSKPEDCREEVACPLLGGYSCMTFDRRENGRRMITRGCKKRDACEVQRKSHKCLGGRHKWTSCVLVGCCHDDLCNEGNRLN